ncbi:MAG: hypothetical protein QM658_17440 [Gordonia sp. (in: high G+C Gram-positive bacteria)]
MPEIAPSLPLTVISAGPVSAASAGVKNQAGNRSSPEVIVMRSHCAAPLSQKLSHAAR